MAGTLIVQALTNLLNNACRHTAEGGHIAVQVFSTGENAVFRVRNDGERIQDEDLPHIFEMYYTTADRSRAQGVGLGLPICRNIVLSHKGTIAARNNERGVTFEFTLPMGD